MITPQEVDDFIARVYPAMAATGLRCHELGQGTSHLVWPLDETQLRPGGYISGPTQMMLVDAGLWVASFTLIGLQEMAVTSDLTIAFLRPAIGGDLHAETVVVSHSRRRIHGTVRLWVEGSPHRTVSHAVGSYAVP